MSHKLILAMAILITMADGASRLDPTCKRNKMILDRCREGGYEIGNCEVGEGTLSKNFRKRCARLEGRFKEKCGEYKCIEKKPECVCTCSAPSLGVKDGKVELPSSAAGVFGGYDTKWDALFPQTDACQSQHGRTKDDPNYYTSNSGIPHNPAAQGFMATHSTHRFLTVHEQTALLIGEGKHGVWRYQDNGFIRVYRGQGLQGIDDTDEAKEKAIGMEFDDEGNVKDDDKDMLEILKKNYKNHDVNVDWDYAFGVEKEEGYWNWLDIPIYHPKFEKKYEAHVPIDLPTYYCQTSSANFPNVGLAWHLMKAQPASGKVGPLGKRAGLDIQENVNSIVPLNLFPDAGIWVNVGQGNEETDKMPNNLEDMEKYNQTVAFKRLDLAKMGVEVYLTERSYHQGEASYLMVSIVLLDEFNTKENIQSVHGYIRRQGKYYEGLVKRGYDMDALKISGEPNHFPTVMIENETEAKKMYGLATYGHHHMARLRVGLTGGGCPTKGGDVSTYPWGNPGSAFPVNYEEITPLCDAVLIDLKLWTNLMDDKQWADEDIFLANSGRGYAGSPTVLYQAHSNLYGVYTDPWNEGKDNPYRLDLTKDGKHVENPGSCGALVKAEHADFYLDFGKVEQKDDYDSYNVTMKIPPRECAKGGGC